MITENGTFDRSFRDITPEPIRRPGHPVGSTSKRALDITVALTALIVLLPLLVMLVVILKSRSRDRVLFAHTRIGYNGTPFKCLKFQTMVSNGDEILADYLARNPEARREWEETRKLRDDPRVTPIGRMMRASSLDELPQLINVLAGSMSLVGPRPIVAAELERYGSRSRSYQACRPGMTGLWQVSGRSDTSYTQRVELDDAYAQAWSFGNDIKILWKTVGVVLRREGSC